MGYNTKGFNGKLAFAITAAALGSSFQHGYNTGVLNNPQQLIETWMSDVITNRTGEEPPRATITMIWSIAVAIFCVGGMIGGVLTGTIADRFGRKGGLLLNNILVIIAVVLESAARDAHSYEMIIAGRFVIGINSGLNAGLAPMYLAEISPVHLRGAVGTVYQLVITISILIAQVLGLGSVLGTEDGWPLLLGITLLPALFQLGSLPFCPETPKYLLVTRGQDERAQESLRWLRGGGGDGSTTDPISIQDELAEMRTEYEASKLVPKVTMRELINNAALRIPLIIALTIMVAQQLSGINAVMFYSTKIFKMAGLTEENASYATMGMGSINVLMTIVSLILVEKAGRKTLLLVGFVGMTVDTILLTIAMLFAHSSVIVSYICIILVFVFVIMFATGPGSIPWFLVNELFNQNARPAAASLAVAINWAANFLVGLGFLPLQEVLGPYVFIIFVVILFLNSIFIYKKVPETKNKTVEEISVMFRQESYK